MQKRQNDKCCQAIESKFTLCPLKNYIPPAHASIKNSNVYRSANVTFLFVLTSYQKKNSNQFVYTLSMFCVNSLLTN